jgi:hypothetical protein
MTWQTARRALAAQLIAKTDEYAAAKFAYVPAINELRAAVSGYEEEYDRAVADETSRLEGLVASKQITAKERDARVPVYARSATEALADRLRFLRADEEQASANLSAARERLRTARQLVELSLAATSEGA